MEIFKGIIILFIFFLILIVKKIYWKLSKLITQFRNINIFSTKLIKKKILISFNSLYLFFLLDRDNKIFIISQYLHKYNVFLSNWYNNIKFLIAISLYKFFIKNDNGMKVLSFLIYFFICSFINFVKLFFWIFAKNYYSSNIYKHHHVFFLEIYFIVYHFYALYFKFYWNCFFIKIIRFFSLDIYWNFVKKFFKDLFYVKKMYMSSEDIRTFYSAGFWFVYFSQILMTTYCNIYDMFFEINEMVYLDLCFFVLNLKYFFFVVFILIWLFFFNWVAKYSNYGVFDEDKEIKPNISPIRFNLFWTEELPPDKVILFVSKENLRADAFYIGFVNNLKMLIFHDIFYDRIRIVKILIVIYFFMFDLNSFLSNFSFFFEDKVYIDGKMIGIEQIKEELIKEGLLDEETGILKEDSSKYRDGLLNKKFSQVGSGRYGG